VTEPLDPGLGCNDIACLEGGDPVRVRSSPSTIRGIPPYQDPMPPAAGRRSLRDPCLHQGPSITTRRGASQGRPAESYPSTIRAAESMCRVALGDGRESLHADFQNMVGPVERLEKFPQRHLERLTMS
jgi:hypothetical protein